LTRGRVVDRLEAAYYEYLLHEYLHLMRSRRHTREQAFQLAATWNGVEVVALKEYVAGQGLRALRRIGGEDE
jgi:hypothetical protein